MYFPSRGDLITVTELYFPEDEYLEFKKDIFRVSSCVFGSDCESVYAIYNTNIFKCYFVKLPNIVPVFTL